jgi:hypothetical protein
VVEGRDGDTVLDAQAQAAVVARGHGSSSRSGRGMIRPRGPFPRPPRRAGARAPRGDARTRRRRRLPARGRRGRRLRRRHERRAPAARRCDDALPGRVAHEALHGDGAGAPRGGAPRRARGAGVALPAGLPAAAGRVDRPRARRGSAHAPERLARGPLLRARPARAYAGRARRGVRRQRASPSRARLVYDNAAFRGGPAARGGVQQAPGRATAAHVDPRLPLVPARRRGGHPRVAAAHIVGERAHVPAARLAARLELEPFDGPAGGP